MIYLFCYLYNEGANYFVIPDSTIWFSAQDLNPIMCICVCVCCDGSADSRLVDSSALFC